LYTGVLELVLNDENLAAFYEGRYPCDFYINEYLILKNEKGEIVDKGRWTKDGFTKLKYKPINNQLFGKFAPRNFLQECAFDLMQNDSITGKLLVGGFGSGKTIISLVHSLDFILGKNQRYDRLVYLRNNIPTKNTVDVGALPADLNAKIKPFAMPLADILGEETQLDLLIENGRIKLDHIGFIRGRSYKNSIIFLSEGQNTTQEIMALVVSRVGDGSILIVEGDLNQCDKNIFDERSGINAMAESLKGDIEFGMVRLVKNERSRFASLSDNILNYKVQ
jgi:predicted ribonuclease YlaK